jgi:CBS domain-containing protein
MQIVVGDVMQVNVETVPVTMTLPELEEKLLSARMSGFPVVDQGAFVGIVSRSDIVEQLCVERELAEKTSDFYRDELGFHEIPLRSYQDVADRVGQRIESMTVGEVMAREPITVEPRRTIEEAAVLMLQKHVQRLPGVDDGRLVGIVTSVDLVRLIAERRVVPS